MARRSEVAWLSWGRYFLGRFFELVGLFVVTASIVLFFGSREMRAMLALTGVGAGVFLLGWLLARRPPPGTGRKGAGR